MACWQAWRILSRPRGARATLRGVQPNWICIALWLCICHRSMQMHPSYVLLVLSSIMHDTNISKGAVCPLRSEQSITQCKQLQGERLPSALNGAYTLTQCKQDLSRISPAYMGPTSAAFFCCDLETEKIYLLIHLSTHGLLLAAGRRGCCTSSWWP